MTATIEALYIFDDQSCILDHIYASRPPKPNNLIRSFLASPAPQSSALYLPDLQPPTIVYSLWHAKLLFIATSTRELQALAILEFLRKVVDILEDYLGSPLLSSKIEDNYETIAQLLAEICDGGIICNTETNALREQVEVSSKLGKLFEQVGLPSNSAALSSQSPASLLRPTPSLNAGPSIPWRRPNIRHTSNELYVDILESLHVILSPSGRPLSARAHGSIAMTTKISGVPDITLSLSAPGGTSQQKSIGIAQTMTLPNFHPCVRLAKWKERPGELSFVPPDGRFMLAAYECDLLPYDVRGEQPPSQTEKLFLPAVVDLRTNLGDKGNEFEAKVTLNTNFPGAPHPKPTSTPRPSLAAARGGSATPGGITNPFSMGAQAGSSGAPALEAVSVSIPFPDDVKTVLDFRASRGDAQFDLRTKVVTWKIPTKEAGSVNGTATLRGVVAGNYVADDNEMDDVSNVDSEYYGDQQLLEHKVQQLSLSASKTKAKYKNLMPRLITASFTIKGWLPSGIKVESLHIDTKRSRGLGAGVTPYKGVKYMTVSRQGVERRV